LTVLGCAGTFPGPDSPCSGYLVEHDGFRLVVDLGAGALGQLQRHTDLLGVDAVYISHLHADHCIDLVSYYYARRHHPGGTAPLLPVFGPAGLTVRLSNSFEVRPGGGLGNVYDLHEVPVGTRQIGPFTVTSDLMNHPIECHGLRIEAGGRSMAYSADTGESDELVTLADAVDLMLCEASWPHDQNAPAGIHLSGRQAGEHAARAGAARLVLTHAVAWHDPQIMLAEARGVFDGPLELAACGRTYDI